LGCVLYEMCVLRHAFESQSLLGLVYCIVSEGYDPIPADRYSEALVELVSRLLVKFADARPTSAETINFPVLAPYIRANSSADGAAPPPPPPPPLAHADTDPSVPVPPPSPTSGQGPLRLGSEPQVLSPRPSHTPSPSPSPPPPPPPLTPMPDAMAAAATHSTFGAVDDGDNSPLIGDSLVVPWHLPPLCRPAPPSSNSPSTSSRWRTAAGTVAESDGGSNESGVASGIGPSGGYGYEPGGTSSRLTSVGASIARKTPTRVGPVGRCQ